MGGFFSKVFGTGAEDTASHDAGLADDGGLGDFVRQMKEDNQTLDGGTRVTTDDVMDIQHGRHGASAYVFDAGRFFKYVDEDLRPSIAPVVAGILTRHCGEKGEGFTAIRDRVFIFHIPKAADREIERNIAMDVIDEIGIRLLGERYGKSARRTLAVARVAPDVVMDQSGKVDIAALKDTLKKARETESDGFVDLITGTPEAVTLDEDRLDWKINEYKSRASKTGWQKEQSAEGSSYDPDGEWEYVVPQKKEDETAEDVPEEDESKVADINVARKARPQTQLDGLGWMILSFRPTWTEEAQEIGCYNALPVRQLASSMLSGEGIYPEAVLDPIIPKLDAFIVREGASRLAKLAKMDSKTPVVSLPLHFSTLSGPHAASILKTFKVLPEHFRKEKLMIEIVGTPGGAAPRKVRDCVAALEKICAWTGLRFPLGEFSASITAQARVTHLVVDLSESAMGQLRDRFLEPALMDLAAFAQREKCTACVWGVQQRKHLGYALAAGFGMINGQALAKQTRSPGKCVAVTTENIRKISESA